MSNKEYLRNKIKEEGDYKAFEYKGYKCRILRATFKRPNYDNSYKDDDQIYLCGYVGLPIGHKYYNQKNINIDTYYGIDKTYNSLCFQPEKDLWWIGFDCGHLHDICRLENVDEYDISDRHSFYKDMDFVTIELQNIVDEFEKENKELE